MSNVVNLETYRRRQDSISYAMAVQRQVAETLSRRAARAMSRLDELPCDVEASE